MKQLLICLLLAAVLFAGALQNDKELEEVKKNEKFETPTLKFKPEKVIEFLKGLPDEMQHLRAKVHVQEADAETLTVRGGRKKPSSKFYQIVKPLEFKEDLKKMKDEISKEAVVAQADVLSDDPEVLYHDALLSETVEPLAIDPEQSKKDLANEMAAQAPVLDFEVLEEPEMNLPALKDLKKIEKKELTLTAETEAFDQLTKIIFPKELLNVPQLKVFRKWIQQKMAAKKARKVNKKDKMIEVAKALTAEDVPTLENILAKHNFPSLPSLPYFFSLPFISHFFFPLFF